jgi:predicted tellurium resistance membrane protein TerC
MEFLANPETWIVPLLTLTLLEIVLGIDNVIFISILAGKLPKEQQAKARQTGLLLAFVTRVALLFSISWLMSLTKPLFTLPILDHPLTGRDLILLLGGLFLIGKSVTEIHHKLEGDDGSANPAGGAKVSFNAVIVQILLLDKTLPPPEYGNGPCHRHKSNPDFSKQLK